MSSIITEEELFENTEAVEKTVKIEIPGKNGKSIRVRGFKDHNEMESSSKEIQNLVHLSSFQMPPFNKLGRYTEGEISSAYFFSHFVVEPQISFEKSLELTKTNFGPLMKAIVAKIFTLSGLTENVLEEKEEYLNEHPFQTGDSDDLH